MAELSTIARPYAQALFASVQQDGAALDAWSELLDNLAQLIEVDAVRDALGNPLLTDAQRGDVLMGLLVQADQAKSALAPAARRFVDLLLANDRILVLPHIAAQFEALKNQQAGTALAEISSAFALDDAQVGALMAGLEKKFGFKLKPVVTVDASLIGGVRVTVGDQVLDTSVRAQLAQLRDTLAT